ncbi:MAG TPA: hypothetical protein VI488_03215 [Candidatus Angelobacter sp.]
MYLSEQQVRRLAGLDEVEVISAIRTVFERDLSATLRMPARTSLDMADGTIRLIMRATR